MADRDVQQYVLNPFALQPVRRGACVCVCVPEFNNRLKPEPCSLILLLYKIQRSSFGCISLLLLAFALPLHSLHFTSRKWLCLLLHILDQDVYAVVTTTPLDRYSIHWFGVFTEGDPLVCYARLLCGRMAQRER